MSRMQREGQNIGRRVKRGGRGNEEGTEGWGHDCEALDAVETSRV